MTRLNNVVPDRPAPIRISGPHDASVATIFLLRPKRLSKKEGLLLLILALVE